MFIPSSSLIIFPSLASRLNPLCLSVHICFGIPVRENSVCIPNPSDVVSVPVTLTSVVILVRLHTETIVCSVVSCLFLVSMLLRVVLSLNGPIKSMLACRYIPAPVVKCCTGVQLSNVLKYLSFWIWQVVHSFEIADRMCFSPKIDLVFSIWSLAISILLCFVFVVGLFIIPSSLL